MTTLQSRRLSRSTRRILLAAALPTLAFTAVAAEPDVLEEVVVTAQKRSQKLQDIPISVTAIGGDAIDNGPRDVQELLRSVPGVSFSGTEPGVARYTIRGVSTGASSPTTGVYLDDVSLVSIATSFSGAIEPPLFDLERIEVLKGPQGTLYGGSAMGGAIKYVSRQPQLDATTVNVGTELATTQDGSLSYEAQSVLNLPLVTDRFAVRLGVSYRHDGGYVDYVPNLTGVFVNRSSTNPPAAYSPLSFSTGSTLAREDANSRRHLAVRLAAKWQVSDTLTVVPTSTVQRSDKANPEWYLANLDGYRASPRSEQPTNDDVDIHSLNIEQQFAGVSLTSLTAYTNRELLWARDYSYFVAGLVPPLLATSSPNRSYTTTKTVSQEFRLASTDADARTKWVVGAYYSDQKDRLEQSVTTFGAGGIFGTGTDIVYQGDQKTSMKQYAVFADVTQALGAQWELGLGLRWYDIRQVLDGVFDGIFNGGHTQIDGKRAKNTGVNPKVSISYRPGEGHLLYASAGKGFRPGGPNRFDTASPLCAPDFQRLGITKSPDSFGPDKLWTYEVGSKNTLVEGKVQATGAVFYTDWKKIQQQVGLPSCGFAFVGNIGAATVKGAELSLDAVVANGFRAGGSFTYTKGEITESAVGVSATVGQAVLDSPKTMGNVYAEWRVPALEKVGGSLRAEYKFRGTNLREFDAVRTITNADGSLRQVPNASQFQRRYDSVNLSLDLNFDRWQARVFVNNLTNEQPVLDDVSTAFLHSVVSTLRPRTIGVGLKTSF